MTSWIIGNKGMLGSCCEILMAGAQMQFITSDREIDITDIRGLRDFVQTKNIGWIINCSGYTDVERAESERDQAYSINADGVRNIAIIAREINAVVVHVSTDYVYDGLKPGEYTEDDQPNPLNIYGKSKLEGDRRLAAEWNKFFIIRTSWLYGSTGKNFVHTMLRLFNERDSVSVIDDQWGSPTYTVDLARFILFLVSTGSDKYGIYHFSNEGKTCWYDFAVKICDLGKKYNLVSGNPVIKPIPAKEYPVSACRPVNSYLSKKKINEMFGWVSPHWEESLGGFLSNSSINDFIACNK